MSQLLIDLAPRYQSAYGFVPLLKPNLTIPGGQYLPVLGSVGLIDNTQSNFEDTTFINGTTELFFAGSPLTKSGHLGNVFAPPVMVGYRKAKKAIITGIDDTDSEIVERYGDGAWEITIQGILVDMVQHKFPLSKLESLRKFFEIPDYVDVVGPIWDVLGIKSIWFSEFLPAGVQGFQDTVSFILQARSIKPVEFYLNGEEE